MKKMITVLMVIVMVIGLTACGNTIGKISLKEGQSAIYIQDDGVVSYAVAEKFDKDYYDEDVLEEKIEKEIKDYNQSGNASVSDAIALNGFHVSGDVATLVLDFSTDYDLLNYIKKYNNVSAKKFYIGDIRKNKKCKIKGQFVSVDQKETKTAKEIKNMDDSILIVNGEYQVETDGDILYVSENCKVSDDGIVTTAKEADGTSYIVYK